MVTAMATLKARKVADFLLTLTEPDVGDLVSNLKLQKLVYYCQGFYLALHGEPLFEEPIVAWQHGPVVEALYHEFKEHCSGAIPVPTDLDFSLYTDEQQEVMKEVYQVYGQFSAWRLRDMTHEESPWKETPQSQEITHSKLTSFFKTLVDES